jgi:diaminopimelate epimerase
MFTEASADVEIRLLNADGSEAEISGNGTRCVAAYICEEQGREKITIRTGAGVKTCTLTARRDQEYEFEMEMGEASVAKEITIKIGARVVRGVPVWLGNPHFVIFVTEFGEKWQFEAAEIQGSAEFKQGVNVEVIVAEGVHDLQARFFERGVGETRSSGTGSCAAAMAAIASGKAESPVRVQALGGAQMVRTEGQRVFLRGAARMVCRGEVFL